MGTSSSRIKRQPADSTLDGSHQALVAADSDAQSAQSELHALGSVHVLDSAHACAPAILCLPEDVLYAILCAWFAANGAQSTRRPESAFTAAGVCQHWRRASLACAPIWSRVFLDFAATTAANEYATMMLERSKSADLDVEFTNVGAYAPSQLKERTLLVLLGRSRTLNIAWGEGYHYDPVHYDVSLLPFLQHAMPQLDDIELRVKGHCEDDLPRGQHILASAPRLRKIKLLGVSLSALSPNSLPNVRNFGYMSSCSASSLRSLLHAWPQLQDLRIHGMVVDSSDAGPVLASPTLEALTLSSHSATQLLVGSSPARLPAVTTLSCGSQGCAAHIASFLGGSPWTALYTLCLYHAAAEPPIIAVFHLLPNLAVLFVGGERTVDLTDFLEQWSKDDHRAVLPRLLVLDLSGKFSQFAMKALVDMLSIRQQRGNGLLQLTLQYALPQNFLPAMIPRLRALVDRLIVRPMLDTV